MGTNGGSALSTSLDLSGDTWFLGGDVRQTRLTLTVKGPPAFGSGVPSGTVEVDFGGYNYQITPVGGFSAVVGARDPMTGAINITTLPFNTVTNESRFDEALVPRLRLAYLELNVNDGQHILRVGQYHQLLLVFVAGSASHIGTPLGYAAGQLGYRSPGIMYQFSAKLSSDTTLSFATQLNRNSWRDELPTCGAMQAAPASNCLPAGISVGEASALPQVEARISLTSGMASNPLPFYAPFTWFAYVTGHWDMKDLSGVGPGRAAPPLRDSLHTMALQLGVKTQHGPFLAALNGWYGQNAGSLLGHVFQMQALPSTAVDVRGFGAWGQLGLGVTTNVSVWAFAGIDHPDKEQAIAAGFTILRNLQLAAQLAFTSGPVLVALEFLYVSTRNRRAPPMAPAEHLTLTGMQPSLTMNFSF
jgi:hypothetical protein